MPACQNCGEAVHQEGNPWVHTATGRYRCLWPYTGDGWAAEHSCPDPEALREQLRMELHAEGCCE